MKTKFTFFVLFLITVFLITATFFPMATLPVSTVPKPRGYYLDGNLNRIKQGTRISFRINNTTMNGIVEEINSYGLSVVFKPNTV